MRSHRLFLICVALAMLLSVVQIARAESSFLLDEPLLVPASQLGFVHLEALNIATAISCEQSACGLEVTQRYHLYNRDRIQAASLRVRLSATPGIQEPTLREEGPSRQSLASTPTSDGTIWEMVLPAGSKRTLILQYRWPVTSQYFVQWRCDLSLLETWDIVDSIHLEFGFPSYSAKDIFIQVSPLNYAYDGKALSWDYEKPEALVRHEVQGLLPSAWERMWALRTSGDHLALANYYVALRDVATRERIPLQDLHAEIIAELEMALQQHADDPKVRLALAEAYRERARQQPNLRLNYLLLAAQELAAAAEGRQDVALAHALSEAYQEVAEAARDSGDPGEALLFLKRAREVPGVTLPQDKASHQEMMLGWALDMAQRGQVQAALTELHDLLSPQMQDALLHYAPTVTAARTEIRLSPSQRSVSYEIQLYPPLAEQSWAVLRELIERLRQVQGCQITLHPDPDDITIAHLEVITPYASPTTLNATREGILKAVGPYDQMLTALIAAPFESEMQALALEHTHWHDRSTYKETVNLGLLADIYDTQSQYVRWRLVELRTTEPVDERAATEARLATLVLREQRQLWEQLPASSYWIYRLDLDPVGLPSHMWLIGWGQQRELVVDQTQYDYLAITETVAAAIASVFVMLGIGRISRRRSA